MVAVEIFGSGYDVDGVVRQIYPFPPKLAAVKSDLEKPPSLESWHPKSNGIPPNKAEPPKLVMTNLNLADR